MRMHLLAISSIALGLACSLWIAVDEARHPQRMRIMNVVWPLTALFGGLLILYGYLRYGRAEVHGTSMLISVAKSSLHCGAGCALGDVVAESAAFFVPAVAVVFGWQSVFADRMYAIWIFDLLLAFLFGIAFQYFAIVPMRNLKPTEGLRAALKADTLSLASWQVGMYALMAFAQLAVYPRLLGHRAPPDSPEFWFAMQVAMLAGFVTSYPINWWLIRSGLKEKM